MAVQMFESVQSRNLRADRASGSIPLNFVLVGTDNEIEAYNAVLAGTANTLYGLIRKSLSLDKKGPLFFEATLTYEPGDPSQAIRAAEDDTAPGAAGTDDPGAAPAEGDPLDTNVSFTTGGGTAHILLSKETRGFAPGTANPTKRAIGITGEEVAGCDIVTAAPEFSVTRKRRTVTLGYLQLLMALTGKTNKFPFWGFPAGSLLYLGANGQGSNLNGFDVTHQFRFSENIPAGDARCTIAPGIVIPGKKGWEYVWTQFKPQVSGTDLFPQPVAAYVERVYDEDDFAQLEIG